MALRILHLSDIHFSTTKGSESTVHHDVRESLIDDVEQVVVPSVGKADAVLVAGDVAFSGKRAEYQDAADWLDRLTGAAGCDEASVLVVPGNHDVDRSRILPSANLLHRELKGTALREATEMLSGLLAAGDHSLSEKLSDYAGFASIYDCAPGSHSARLWTRRFALDEQCTLNFVGLSSAQLSDKGDVRGSLLLGRDQYVIEREPSVEHVVVMHHPIEWLKDRKEASQYLHSRARIIVFGHNHFQEIHKIEDLSHGERLSIGSGAVTPEEASDIYVYRYNMLEFSTVSTESGIQLDVTVHPRVWASEQTRFDADRAAVGGSTSATLRLKCPSFKNAPAVAMKAEKAKASSLVSAGTVSIGRLRYLFWRYLTWSQRIAVLSKADLLPRSERATLASAIEQGGFERAAAEDKLAVLWELMKDYVPPARRDDWIYRGE